ncbi:hypothetical protein [Halioxenophilus aromaticivorans]|uniref:SMP-30/Gluconolactonase/LRE-like region domain-containing protein n=1 Tax=Halioxenophilus aromaticivorans TaxID=1306992 RepID=A0AAV3U2L7_9ALTE
MFNRKVLLYLLLLSAVVSAEPDVKPVAKPLLTLPAEFGYPNGLAYLPNGDLIVGSVTKPSLLRVNAQGEIISTIDIGPSLWAGTALRFDTSTNLLWVASPDFLGKQGLKRRHRIGVVDIARGKVITAIDMPDKGFGNDIALDGQGGAYVTDSSSGRIYHLSDHTAAMVEVADLGPVPRGAIGPAGIALSPSQAPAASLLVGHYSTGQLQKVDLAEANRVESLLLSRPLDNPDGMVWAKADQLYLAEGAVESGEGKLSRLDLNTHPVQVETLVSDVNMPVNLSIWQGQLAFSEAGIRHAMLPNSNLAKPKTFQIFRLAIEPNPSPVSTLAILPPHWYPESLAEDHQGRVYISSATESAIALFDPATGQVSEFVADPGLGLNSVQGLYVDNQAGLLYACTAELGLHKLPGFNSSLLAFNLNDSSLAGRWPIPGGGLCNDIDAIDDSSLLVTDTTGHRILQFDSATQNYTVWSADELFHQGDLGLNGIAYSDQDQAVYVTLFQAGKLIKVAVDEKGEAGAVSEIQLPSPLNGPDAVRVLGPNQVLVFENGVPHGDGGGLTGIAIDGAVGRPVRMLSSDANPPSGLVANGAVLYVESYFGDLFGASKANENRVFSLKRMALPVGF